MQFLVSKSFFRFLVTVNTEGKVTIRSSLPDKSHNAINYVFAKADEVRLASYLNENNNCNNLHALVLKYYQDKQWSITEVQQEHCMEKVILQYFL